MLYCGPGHEADLPGRFLGAACPWCDEPVGGDEAAALVPHGGDDGPVVLAWHAACFLRTVCGSVAHQRGRCCCCPPFVSWPATTNLTMRQEARMAVRLFRRRRATAPLLGLPAHVHPAHAAAHAADAAELA